MEVEEAPLDVVTGAGAFWPPLEVTEGTVIASLEMACASPVWYQERRM